MRFSRDPIPHLTDPGEQKLLLFFDFRCAYCSVDLDESYHRDHYWPRWMEGDKAYEDFLGFTTSGRAQWIGRIHHASNIVPACPRCNKLKSATRPDEFLEMTPALGLVTNPKLDKWDRAWEDERRIAWDPAFDEEAALAARTQEDADTHRRSKVEAAKREEAKKRREEQERERRIASAQQIVEQERQKHP